MAGRGSGGVQRVLLHPGLMLVAGPVLGMGLQFLKPLPMDVLPGTARLGAALLLLAGGTALLAWAFRALRTAATPAEPGEPPRALVRTGPFRFSRNPMYVANLSIQAGLGLGLDSLWVIGFAALSAALLGTLVVPSEERILEQSFGEGYAEYRRGVRRWM